MTTIYLVRHGRTKWNTEDRLQGFLDSPLLEEGLTGAIETGKKLANIEFSACYSSMQFRAQKTAQLILENNNNTEIPHFHNVHLNEINFGDWEGVQASTLLDNLQFQNMRYNAKEYDPTAHKGESYQDLLKRTEKIFYKIAKLHQPNSNILIVSHGMTLTLLCAVLQGLPWWEFRNTELHQFMHNTAISKIIYENGKAELIDYNNTNHLTQE